MVTEAGNIDEPRMWSAIERLEAASQATREEQVAMNARMDAIREEQVATNVRVDAIEKEQISMNARLDAIEKEQVTTNLRLESISEAQHAMTLRIDAMEARMTERIDRLFYAIMAGSIGVIGALVAHGFIIS